MTADCDALTALAGGDTAVLAALIDRHGPLVAGSCRRQAPAPAVDDCVQAVFLVLSRRALAAARAPSLESWLLRTTTYICARARRAQHDRKRAEARAAAAFAQDRAQEPPLSHDCDEHLDACLERLSEIQRTVVLRTYVGGQSGSEVAASLGISPTAARQHAHRGLERLRQLLRQRGIPIPPASVVAALAPPSSLTNAGLPSAAARAYADGAIPDWQGRALRHGIWATAALLAACVMGAVGLAGWGFTQVRSQRLPLPADQPIAAPPPFAETATPPPLIRISGITWNWDPAGPSLPYTSGGSGMQVRFALTIPARLRMTGGRLILDHVVTNEGLELAVPPVQGVTGRETQVASGFPAPPLGTHGLTLQGRLEIDRAVTAPLEVTVLPPTAAVGAWFAIAGMPDMTFHAGWEGTSWLMRGSAAFLSRTDVPIFHAAHGDLTPFGTGMDFVGARSPTISYRLAQRAVSIDIPIYTNISTMTLPFTVTASLCGRLAPQPGDQARAPDPMVAADGWLPVSMQELPPPPDPRLATLHVQCQRVMVQKSLSPLSSERVLKTGRWGASDAAFDRPTPPLAEEDAWCMLQLQVPARQEAEILAIDAMHVTAAVTDGGESVAGLEARRSSAHDRVDDTLSEVQSGTSVVLRVPEERATVFSVIEGQATVVVASVAPVHLHLPLAAPWLDRWLAVPGHPDCALRIHLGSRRMFDHDDAVVHLDRTGAMALTLRHVRLLDDQGHLLDRDGGGSGGGAPGNYPLDIYLLGEHPSLILDGAVFTTHETSSMPFRLMQVPIAVPGPHAPSAAPSGPVEKPPAQVTMLIPVAAGQVPPPPAAVPADAGGF